MNRAGYLLLTLALAGIALLSLRHATAVAATAATPDATAAAQAPGHQLTPALVPFPGHPPPRAPDLRPAPLPAGPRAIALDGDIHMTITLNTDFVCDPGAPSVITVPVGSQLVYCYVWTNATTTTFEIHDLEDSVYGSLFYQFPLSLPPGDTIAWFFLPGMATTTTTNIALWTAYDPITPLTRTTVASATVIVSGTLPPTADFGPPYLVSSQTADSQRNVYLLARNRGGGQLTWEQGDCGTASWLTLPITSGVIPLFSSQYITTTFDSTGLATGSYTTTLCFDTNDPVNPQVTIDAYLNVIAGGFDFEATVGLDPDLCAVTQVISTTPGAGLTYCYTVYNGLDTLLEFHQFESENYGFLNYFPYPLLPGESLQFLLHTTAFVTVTDHVTWTSQSTDGTLVISDSDITTVTVAGEAQPRAHLQPEEINASLPRDSSLTRRLTLYNVGAADLNWSLATCSSALPGWLAFAPDAGSLPFSQATEIDVTLDSTGLISGTYAADLCFNSNDPAAPVITIPVTLEATGGLANGLLFTKTVGLVAGECATTTSIDVTGPTAVTYCYQVANQTAEPFLVHDVVDSELGVLFDEFHFPLNPGEQFIFLVTGVTISETTSSTTTWTAYDPFGAAYVASASATVNVVPPAAVTLEVGLTVGEGPGCATTTALTAPVPPTGLAVTYCYRVTNSSLSTLNWHDVADSVDGTIRQNSWQPLSPGATYFFTRTAVIYDTTHNTTTWHAYNPGGANAWGAATAVVHNPLTAYRVVLPLIVR